MSTMLKELIVEIEKISEFINAWIEENPYNGDIDAHNAKYRKDFKAFFDSSNFAHEKYENWIR